MNTGIQTAILYFTSWLNYIGLLDVNILSVAMSRDPYHLIELIKYVLLIHLNNI